MSTILGISCFYHDSSISVIENGKIIFALQEERFSRKKHDKRFPAHCIKYLKEKTNYINKIDKVVFYEKPILKLSRLIKTYLFNIPLGLNFFLDSNLSSNQNKIFAKMQIKHLLAKSGIQIKSNNIIFIEHHLSHAASAYFATSLTDSLVITLDGVGEESTLNLYHAYKNQISLIKKIDFPNSLGLLYSAFTYYLGFKVNSGEYKIMGLAPYGKPIYLNLIKKNLLKISEDGSFNLNIEYFGYLNSDKIISKKFSTLFNRERRDPQKDQVEQFHMDVACSIQKLLEEILILIVKHAYSLKLSKNICLAGGVALNCVANSKIRELNIFDNIWVQPAAGDAGGSLGAALFYNYSVVNKTSERSQEIMQSSYLGNDYEDKEIKKSLDNLESSYKVYDEKDLLNLVAKEISEKKIVGWFQGRMEFGPRALGNRSILADPRYADMQKYLNLKIKFREGFRPFAPSILFEELENWFEFKGESKYMLFTANLKKKHRYQNKDTHCSIPSAVHLDFSARIQTVTEKDNYKYYNLIKKFYTITDVPILINTSFNIRGEPLVCTPEDAYKCFMGTDMDILVINNFILNKKDQKKDRLNYDYRNQFELD